MVGIAIVVVPPWLAEPPPPTRMTGDLNIAVTPFTTQGRVTQEGVLLAEAASQDLRARVKDIEPALQVDLRGPGDSGITAVSDASAPALAERINADIVLHGSLQENSTGTTVSARFYLNRAKLPSAGELAGNYDYGTTIRAPFALSISPQTRADVRARLVGETDDVATFLAAVGDYLTHKYGLAQIHLDEVLRGTARTDVRALALVLLGNVLAQENHPLRARALYAEAADYPITHARATYGKAEVQYAIARGTCTGRHVDVRGLQQARAAFANVPLDRSAAVPPASIALLRAKVAFGLGQVELCLSHSGSIDNWRQARGEMESVVASYRSNVPELRDDAAEAYAGIGLADLHLQPVDYAAASAAYTKAGQLTSIDARRMFFARMAAYASAHPSVPN